MLQRSGEPTTDLTPAVSVLMCVYNGQRFLREAIDSILGQSWRDFEFVIVDDASTDETPTILDTYGGGRIVRLRNATNIGLTRSLNRGLEVCRGEYIARIDADDLAEPERLARQVAALAADPATVILGTWTTEIDDEGREIGRFEIPPEADYVAWELTWRNVVYPSSVLMRRGPIEALGGYDASVPYAQDHDLWTRAVMAGRRVALLPERLARYRRSSGQITCTRAAEQDECGLAVRQRYLKWLLGRDVPLEQIDAMRRILGPQAVGSDSILQDGLSLLQRVLRSTLKRADRTARPQIREAVSEALRRQAVEALYRSGRPGLSAHLLAAAVRAAPARAVEPRIWRHLAGVAKAGALSLLQPQPPLAESRNGTASR